MARVLVTGAAGFIGYHVAQALLDRGDSVVGLDNLNAYYDVSLKMARLERIQDREGFDFARLDLCDRAGVESLFSRHSFDSVVHLAAQAGVRYSIENPHSYVDSNLVGFINILDACRHGKIGHLVYASSSSVYGANAKVPFSVHDNVDHPLSLYAATKKANELMAHTYSSLYGLPTTGLRFFTVYGPFGRPDMALFKFTKRILAGEPIEVYNHGRHSRDFTYIDDIVEGVLRTLDHKATPNPDWTAAAPDPGTSFAPYRIYNIGRGGPVELMKYIEVLEQCLGRKAEKTLLPLQPGDVEHTSADVESLTRDVGYQPSTPVEVGVKRFVEWYLDFYGKKR